MQPNGFKEFPVPSLAPVRPPTSRVPMADSDVLSGACVLVLLRQHYLLQHAIWEQHLRRPTPSNLQRALQADAKARSRRAAAHRLSPLVPLAPQRKRG